MADYLVTYDFKDSASKQWEEFVKCAELEGFIYVYNVGEELARLTNTTLWGEFENKTAAKAAFERAQAAAGKKIGRTITLEKRVITKMADVFVRSDKKKKPDSRWTKSTSFETCRAHQKNDPFFAY
ncbi:hypothetical protein JET14_15135 [Martelella lutilitoris]|uniref:Uncharacterized protein n=1 Tax=Martelella lutilitoris TaxID=2583532 RepID=A0A7T7KKF4_9HYPH|nr:hypothetical protein [Martelella lutilitoris]QQM29630.1 hypothetical protein JET14_15135 [Martelella lutilitoris]